MQRTLITENADGTFQCTVTLSADELPMFLIGAQLQGDTPAMSAADPKEKPPAQVVPVSGFEAFGAMHGQADSQSLGFDPMALANHAPFQRFAESISPLPEEGDSVRHALELIGAAKDVALMIKQYRDWHDRRWPGEVAVPGVAQ